MKKRPYPLLPLLFALLWVGAGCASTSKISEENKQRINESWRLYLSNSPEWPQAKVQWIAMGETEKRALVNLLIRDAQSRALRPSRDKQGRYEPGWNRAVEEIESLGPCAVAPLIDALRQLEDETVVPPCILALSHVAATPDLLAAFTEGDAENPVTFRCRVVRTLALMEDPEALEMNLAILTGPWDWQVRATAADVLKGYEGPMRSEVIAALKTALDDEDPFVVTKAKAALEQQQRRGLGTDGIGKRNDGMEDR